MSKARKKKKGKKLGLILLIEVIVLLVLVACFAWYYVNSKLDMVVEDDSINKEEIDVSDAATDAMEEDYTTIALFGLDAREGGDMTKSGVAHSDAIIIASIDNKTKEVRLASVYRDCFLELSNNSNSTEKVTHAYIYGGPTCSMETLNKNLDLNIKDYVAVDFKALTKAIDALGGVTIDVKSKEINNLNHNLEEQVRVTGIASEGVWSAGEQTLNGTQATAYARIRKVGNGDFERTQRQRAVITAMVKKAKDSDLSTLNNAIDKCYRLLQLIFQENRFYLWLKIWPVMNLQRILDSLFRIQHRIWEAREALLFLPICLVMLRTFTNFCIRLTMNTNLRQR
jgi:LCP family protein required for cell wall assembly